MIQPLILLTNDDGIKSPGIIAAAKELAKLGELWVAAPLVQQTSAGRSHPPKSRGIIVGVSGFPDGVKAFSIEGSPSQCVDHAMLELLPRHPDIVISGINSGINVGVDITRSGTIGAALEAASYGVPAIAASLEIHPDEIFSEEPQGDFSTAAYFVGKFTKAVLNGDLFSIFEEDIDILKIEIPAAADKNTPWEVSRLSKKTYYHVEKPIRDSVKGTGTLRWRIEKNLTQFDAGTDAHCVIVNKNVSVTPLSLDMTSRVSLQKLQTSLTESL